MPQKQQSLFVMSMVPNAVSLRVCQNWFARFKMGDFDLEDKKRQGRPSELDDHELEELISTDPCLSTRELALRLSVSNSTVYDRLKALGKVQKLGKWVPHKLSEMNILTRLLQKSLKVPLKT